MADIENLLEPSPVFDEFAALQPQEARTGQFQREQAEKPEPKSWTGMPTAEELVSPEY